MQRDVDATIQARVRILLAKRWVDLRSVTIGTTNGVVYIGGSLRCAGAPPGEPARTLFLQPEEWLDRIRREISALPEVRDVVLKVEDEAASRAV
jgi:hypothetical protein